LVDVKKIILFTLLFTIISCGGQEDDVISSTENSSSSGTEESSSSGTEENSSSGTEENSSSGTEESSSSGTEENSSSGTEESSDTTTTQESTFQTSTIGLTEDSYFDPFTKYIEVQNLRIFITPEVSDKFAKQVSKIYELMLGNNNLIDESLRNGYFETLSNEYVFQRVGYSGPDYYEEKTGKNFDEALNPHPFNGPYRDNSTDYIWETPTANTDEKIGEVVEHLLHTVTNIALTYTYPEWNWMNSNSEIYKATMEAIENNVFDVSDYQRILDRGDDEGYYSIITQEFMFWVIVVEWGLAEIYELPSNEFNASTPAEIESKLPLAHELYKEFIEKIFTPPSINELRSIINN